MTGPQGTTDWSRYGLADIWNMVAKDDFAPNNDHARAWEKMRVLCDQQAKSLRTAAAQISERWPPQHSEAAAAFAARMESLAQVFDEASSVAGRNGWTLSGVTVGLADAHGQIAQLRDTWGQYQWRQDERVRITRQTLGPLAFGDDEAILMMSNFEPTRSLVNLQGAPQVPAGWQHDLDRQARDIMINNDKELVEARSQVAQAPVVNPHSDSGEWPPRVPPDLGGGGGGGFSGGGPFTSPLFNPPVGQPGRSPFAEGEPLPEPVLDGVAPPIGGPLPGFPVGGGPLGGLPGSGGAMPWIATPMGPAIAPGGVIGDRAPAAARPIGTSRAGATGGMVPMGGAAGRPGAAGASKGGFVAPPGGLIGGRPQRKGGPGGAVPVGGSAGSRRKRNEDDDEWAVASGVPGVLIPDPEPDVHDPGPGVIGIDR